MGEPVSLGPPLTLGQRPSFSLRLRTLGSAKAVEGALIWSRGDLRRIAAKRPWMTTGSGEHRDLGAGTVPPDHSGHRVHTVEGPHRRFGQPQVALGRRQGPRPRLLVRARPGRGPTPAE